MLHSSVYVEWPSQVPLYISSTILNRVLVRFPPSQLFEHSPSCQSLHSQSTEKSDSWSYLKNYFKQFCKAWRRYTRYGYEKYFAVYLDIHVYYIALPYPLPLHKFLQTSLVLFSLGNLFWTLHHRAENSILYSTLPIHSQLKCIILYVSNCSGYCAIK